MSRLRSALVVLAVLAFLVGPAGEAAAAPAGSSSTVASEPGLVLRECFADWKSGACQVVTHPSLELASGVVVSPDGSSVYVAAMHRELPALGSNAITEFSRTESGRLRPVGCLTFAGGRRCRAARVPLEGVRRLAVAPDGRNVYALADDGIAEFARAPSGRLRPIGCLAFDREGPGTSRCKHPDGGLETDMSGLVLSPDGHELYVTAGNYLPRGGGDKFVGRMLQFRRRADGTLAPIGCFRVTHDRSCLDVGTRDLGEPVMTADGTALYAVEDNAVLRFTRWPDGFLSRPECVIGHAPRCAQTEGVPAPGFSAVAVSGDGGRLYLGTTRSITAYTVAEGGLPTREATLPSPGYTLALSPDGSRLYGTDSSGVDVFEAGPGGLRQLGAEYPDQGAEGLAVTPDGSALLVASWFGSDLLVLTPAPAGP
jgi:DNA-binding beta-propeller fold protein YncE